MQTVKVEYKKETNSFLGSDGFDNYVSFKEDRTQDSAAKNSSGSSLGPMTSMLMAMGSCSGIDVVSILKKQRMPLEDFVVVITGEREKDAVPSLWKVAHLQFLMDKAANLQAVQHAAQLSIDKYCSVAETLRRAGCVVTFSVETKD